MKKMLLVIALLFGFAGCASNNDYQESVSTIKDKNQPCWVKNPTCKDTQSHIAVVGISRRYEDRQSAERDAIKDAQIRATEVFSTRVRSIQTEVSSIVGKSGDVLTRGLAGDDVVQKTFDQKLKGFRPINYSRQVVISYYGVRSDAPWESFALILVPRNMAKQIIQNTVKGKSLNMAVERAVQKLDEQKSTLSNQ